nr:hypothetical protein GCM10020093_042550 [Planobispora longispora]
MADFPRSAVPAFLIAGALAIDLAFLIRNPVVRALAAPRRDPRRRPGPAGAERVGGLPAPDQPGDHGDRGAGLAALWLAGEWFLTRYRLRARNADPALSRTPG